MKATGIVRRIDDLGRVVIPKEVRKILNIREGDPLEIFTDSEGIILKKYSAIGNMSDFAISYAAALYETTSNTVIITDRDMVITCAGHPKCTSVSLSNELQEVIEKRNFKLNTVKDIIPLTTRDITTYAAQAICPIIVEGDPIGAIILATGKVGTVYGETETKLVQAAARFIQKQMEM